MTWQCVKSEQMVLFVLSSTGVNSTLVQCWLKPPRGTATYLRKCIKLYKKRLKTILGGGYLVILLIKLN